MLFEYTLAAFGLAYVVGHSSISLPFRMLLDPGEDYTRPREALRAFVLTLAECPACFGFWTGACAGMLHAYGIGSWMPESPVVLPKPLFVLGLGLYTTGSNYLLARLTKLIPSGSKE